MKIVVALILFSGLLAALWSPLNLQALGEVWTARFNGPGNGADVLTDLAVDSAGNAYVTGSSKGTSGVSESSMQKYDPSGARVWEVRRGSPAGPCMMAEGRALDLGPDGSVFLIGNEMFAGDEGCSVARTLSAYSPAGEVRWEKTNAGAFGYETSVDVAATADGGVIVLASSRDADSMEDVVVVRHSADTGEIEWETRFDLPDELIASEYVMTSGVDLALDASGNIFVAADLWDSSGDADFLVLKFDPAGTILWHAVYEAFPDPAPGSPESAQALAVDASGNAYVTGVTTTPETGNDVVLVKFNSDGLLSWARRFDSAGGDEGFTSYGRQVLALDGQGNAYLSTQGLDSITGDRNWVTLSYDPAGSLRWSSAYGGGSADDAATALAVDGSGNVFVTGYSIEDAAVPSLTVAQYNSSTGARMAKGFVAIGTVENRPTEVALGPGGAIWVAGRASSASGNSDYALANFSGLPSSPDADNDGLLDAADNCPSIQNPAQFNSDGAADGGDACDACPASADNAQCVSSAYTLIRSAGGSLVGADLSLEIPPYDGPDSEVSLSVYPAAASGILPVPASFSAASKVYDLRSSNDDLLASGGVLVSITATFGAGSAPTQTVWSWDESLPGADKWCNLDPSRPGLPLCSWSFTVTCVDSPETACQVDGLSQLGVFLVGKKSSVSGHVKVELHTVDQRSKKNRNSKEPLPDVMVKVFDRTSPEFIAAYGRKHLREHFAEIYESDVALVAYCVTDSEGQCTTNESGPGRYLILAKYESPDGETLYAAKRKSPEDYLPSAEDPGTLTTTTKLKFKMVIRKDGHRKCEADPES